MIWREKRIPLIILGVFLLGNAIFFFTYRVQYQNRLRDLDDQKEATQQRLQQVHAQRLATERQIAMYRKTQNDLASIYNEHWATEPERFTALVSEVKKLAVASEMVPKSISFAETQTETQKETRSGPLGTTVVTISFPVQGSYQQVRRLINLLELSDQFVIIDGIALSGSGAAGANGPLTLSLRLKSIFRSTASPVKPNQQM
jgi:hypothetical protein